MKLELPCTRMPLDIGEPDLLDRLYYFICGSLLPDSYKQFASRRY
jgi:hypothetical protein